MKTFLKLALIVCCFGHLTSVMANFQPHIAPSENETRQTLKAYIPLKSLHFSEEGVFLKSNADEWEKIDQLGYDSQGYYIAAGIFDGLFRQRHYIAKCNNCGREYQNHCPQPCESCDMSNGFEVVYLEDSYWD